MTTNNSEVVAYLHTNKENPEHRGTSLRHDASCTNTLINTEPLIRLSDYEALQAKYGALGVDVLVEALEAVVAYDESVDDNYEDTIKRVRVALATYRKQGGEL